MSNTAPVGNDVAINDVAIKRRVLQSWREVDTLRRADVSGWASHGAQADRGRRAPTLEEGKSRVAPVCSSGSAAANKMRRPQREPPRQRQRRQKQQEIARENERMGRRLKEISSRLGEKTGRGSRPRRSGNRVAGASRVSKEHAASREERGVKLSRRGGNEEHSCRNEQRKWCPLEEVEAPSSPREGADTSSPRDRPDVVRGRYNAPGSVGVEVVRGRIRYHTMRAPHGGTKESSNDVPRTDTVAINARRKRHPEAGWGELYREREALAEDVAMAAQEAAQVRSRVEALRAKTLCTEGNARRYRP